MHPPRFPTARSCVAAAAAHVRPPHSSGLVVAFQAGLSSQLPVAAGPDRTGASGEATAAGDAEQQPDQPDALQARLGREQARGAAAFVLYLCVALIRIHMEVGKGRVGERAQWEK